MKQRFKKTLTFALSLTLLFGTTSTVSAKQTSLDDELGFAYQSLTSYADQNDIPLTISAQQFAKNYYSQENSSDVTSYLSSYSKILQSQEQYATASISKGDTWYYNIGTRLPANATPNYSKYNLLHTVKKGDIIHEANGGFGITAHTAIVEGIFFDSSKKTNYIRVIEALPGGIVRSCLDDQRIDDKAVTIYRVPNVSSRTISNAVRFCIGELGSSYLLDFAKDTSSGETNWYCSELVWASYKNQGIDIETTSYFNEPGITPRDIARSSRVTAIPYN